jgi:transcriptional regulator with XRE-family HTH domain
MGISIGLGELGAELRRQREERDMSLRDVEDATGVSAATLSRVERGNTPEFGIVTKLAQWLDVSVRAAGEEPSAGQSDADLKRSIELHLRANKNISPRLARSIADSFDLVMQLELKRAKAKRDP